MAAILRLVRPVLMNLHGAHLSNTGVMARNSHARSDAMYATVLWFVLGMGVWRSAAAQTVTYQPVAASFEARISDQPCIVPDNLPTKKPYMVASPLGNWSATVLETDSGVVPYDQARACVSLRGPNGAVRAITVGAFRTLELQWLNERLLYAFTDVGHIAGVGQLFDVVDSTRLYARTEIYSIGAEK